jgi:hypothetical protein
VSRVASWTAAALRRFSMRHVKLCQCCYRDTNASASRPYLDSLVGTRGPAHPWKRTRRRRVPTFVLHEPIVALKLKMHPHRHQHGVTDETISAVGGV